MDKSSLWCVSRHFFDDWANNTKALTILNRVVMLFRVLIVNHESLIRSVGFHIDPLKIAFGIYTPQKPV